MFVRFSIGFRGSEDAWRRVGGGLEEAWRSIGETLEEALRIAESHEKHSFKFFAFLPPYIGVSGSLAHSKR